MKRDKSKDKPLTLEDLNKNELVALIRNRGFFLPTENEMIVARISVATKTAEKLADESTAERKELIRELDGATNKQWLERYPEIKKSDRKWKRAEALWKRVDRWYEQLEKMRGNGN